MNSGTIYPVEALPSIKLELIPDIVRESTARAAFKGFFKYKEYLESHPIEKREFYERVEELERLEKQNRTKKSSPA